MNLIILNNTSYIIYIYFLWFKNLPRTLCIYSNPSAQTQLIETHSHRAEGEEAKAIGRNKISDTCDKIAFYCDGEGGGSGRWWPGPRVRI